MQKVADGAAEVELAVQDHHRGGGGTEAVNGGIVAYLFDAAMGLAARSTWDAGVRGQVTVTMTVQYLAMLEAEHRVRAVGRVVRRGGTTVFTEAEALDERDAVAARATGIYRLFR
ncbi:MAG: PaaI family thioesterase [Actinomycetia bacterium]|nr:PaaI family thioesterase [Actinomycetes bacterium]